MWVDFEELPETSRIWVYQADRKILPDKEAIMARELMTFTQQWTVHGQPIEASFKILESQFVVIAANEETGNASGCSIDSSVHVLKQLGHQTGIDFFNRGIVPFLVSDKIKMIPLQELKQKFDEGIWTGATITFNTLAGSIGALKKEWRVPAEKSWVKRYMKPTRIGSVAG